MFVIFIIICIIAFIINIAIKENSDKNELLKRPLESKFSEFLKIINSNAFDNKAKVFKIDRSSFNFYDSVFQKNQIIKCIYGNNFLIIEWKYNYLQKEVIHKKTFNNVKNISILDQQSMANTLLTQMANVKKNFENSVNNKTDLVDIPTKKKYSGESSSISNLFFLDNYKKELYDLYFKLEKEQNSFNENNGLLFLQGIIEISISLKKIHPELVISNFDKMMSIAKDVIIDKHMFFYSILKDQIKEYDGLDGWFKILFAITKPEKSLNNNIIILNGYSNNYILDEIKRLNIYNKVGVYVAEIKVDFTKNIDFPETFTSSVYEVDNDFFMDFFATDEIVKFRGELSIEKPKVLLEKRRGKLNSMFVATVKEFKGTLEEPASLNINGQYPIFLNVLGGTAPSCRVIDRIEADLKGFVVGETILVSCTENEYDSIYGRTFNITKASDLTPGEIVSALTGAIGEPNIIDVT